MNTLIATGGNRAGRQRGVVTLVIGILLLLLVSMVLLFGARVGVMEQRISANEYRTKEAFGAAEAGMGMAVEFLKANREDVRSAWRDAGMWVQCDADSCPTLPEFADEPIENIWRFQFDIDGNPDNPVNDFAGADFALMDNNATYEANYFLCQVETDSNGVFEECASGPVLSSDEAGGTQDFAVLVTARGYSADRQQDGDNPFGGTAQTEVRQIVSTFASLPIFTPAPIVASSTISGSGTFDVVGNPNGGGRGVPLAIWSGEDFHARGDWLSCEIDEYMSQGSTTFVGENNDVMICDSNCECTQEDGLSHRTGGSIAEDLDIVDVDGNQGKTMDASNFPDDLFKFTFGVPKEDYQQVKDLATVLQDCSSFTEDTSGFYWIEGSCGIRGDAGSADTPLLVVVEGDFSMNANTNFFGMIFSFTCTGACAEATGTEITEGEWTTNGTARFYGAMIADHQMDRLNGTFHIVYNEDVLNKVRTLDQLLSMGPVPGSWTDTLTVN